MKLSLVSYTKEPEITTAIAGKLCYSPHGYEGIKKSLDRKKTGKFLHTVIGMGHHSLIEHASYSFLIEGISRACTHQLVRHRIASYSQQSQRYVSEKHFDFVIPPTIEADKKIKQQFIEFMEKAQEIYNNLMKSGIPKEDARFILPNAVESKIFVTMNARELLHFFCKRLCLRSQWEIREMAEKMLELVKKVSPNIFSKAGPACVHGPCPEGKLTCGKIKQIREKYRK
jgi:thymidylate synthase (FAD)